MGKRRLFCWVRLRSVESFDHMPCCNDHYAESSEVVDDVGSKVASTSYFTARVCSELVIIPTCFASEQVKDPGQVLQVSRNLKKAHLAPITSVDYNTSSQQIIRGCTKAQ